MKGQKNDYKRYAIYIIAAALFVSATLFFVLSYWKIMRNMNINSFKHYILSYGKYSALCFIIIYSLKPIVFIVPSSLLSILAGNIFGSYIALILNMIGCFFSGTLAFFLAKILGKPFVEKILKNKIMKLDSDIEKHGFIIMLLMRLSFIFNYDALSYAGGLTKMKYSDFILGTLIGIFPEMLTYSFMGGNLESPFSIKFILPIIVLAVVVFISSISYKKYKKAK